MKPYNEQIKEGRKKAGLTQKELAERAGVTVRQANRIENRHSFPDYLTLLKICQILDISIVIEPGHAYLKS